jgi:dTMP kinase
MSEKERDCAKGRFIVICGIDGSGKSTQQRLLAQRLRIAGRSVVCTRNPTDWYREDPFVREFLHCGRTSLRMETLALMAAADRMRQLDVEILPLLAGGADVICDRYVWSTYAYFAMRGANMAFVDAVNGLVSRPDRAVLLVLDPAEAVRRVRERRRGRMFEERDEGYLRGVQECLLTRWPSSFLRLDAGQSEQVLAEVVFSYVTS